MKVETRTFPVVLADADWFLSESLNAAAISKVAADFSNGVYCQGGTPQRVAFANDSATATTVTVTYYSSVGDPEALVTDVLTGLVTGTVQYTSRPVHALVSVAATKTTGATLTVGFQGYPYYSWGPGDHDKLTGLGFMPTYIASAGHTGIATEVTLATEGTPAANAVGYDNASQTIHFCYPVDGSSNATGGILTVSMKVGG